MEAAWAAPPAQPAAQAVADSAVGDSEQRDVQQELHQQQQQTAAVEDAAGGEEADLPKPAACTAAAQQPPFQEAALAAAAACGLAGDEAGGGVPALPLLAAVEAAPTLLAAMSLDEFPRLLEWSEGLCGLTLLPLRCVRVWVWAGWVLVRQKR